jgi:hypothetical protein
VLPSSCTMQRLPPQHTATVGSLLHVHSPQLFGTDVQQAVVMWLHADLQMKLMPLGERVRSATALAVSPNRKYVAVIEELEGSTSQVMCLWWPCVCSGRWGGRYMGITMLGQGNNLLGTGVGTGPCPHETGWGCK